MKRGIAVVLPLTLVGRLPLTVGLLLLLASLASPVHAAATPAAHELAVQPSQESKPDQAQSKDKTVYLAEGSTIFHRKDCNSLSGRIVERRLSELGKGFDPCGICKPLAPDPPPTVPADKSIPYLVTAPTVARKTPESGATIVNRFQPLQVIEILEIVLGWARVRPATGAAENTEQGWIAANPDNLIADDLFSAVLRFVQVQEKSWPTTVKIDIIKRHARVGFTKEQVRLALGDPSMVATEETAGGTTEVWTYPSRTISFKGERVAAIRTIELSSESAPTRTTPSRPDSASATAGQTERSFQITSIDLKVTEANDTWWRYAWKLGLKNDSAQPIQCDVTIEFQDRDGFVIDSDDEHGLVVPAQSEQTFTGYQLVSMPGARNVARTNAKGRCR